MTLSKLFRFFPMNFRTVLRSLLILGVSSALVLGGGMSSAYVAEAKGLKSNPFSKGSSGSSNTAKRATVTFSGSKIGNGSVSSSGSKLSPKFMKTKSKEEEKPSRSWFFFWRSDEENASQEAQMDESDLADVAPEQTPVEQEIERQARLIASLPLDELRSRLEGANAELSSLSIPQAGLDEIRRDMDRLERQVRFLEGEIASITTTLNAMGGESPDLKRDLRASQVSLQDVVGQKRDLDRSLSDASKYHELLAFTVAAQHRLYDAEQHESDGAVAEVN